MSQPHSLETLRPASKNTSPKGWRKDKKKPDSVPLPSHRHASPSAPWPWVDLEDGETPNLWLCPTLILYPEVDEEQLYSRLPPIPKACTHEICDGCYGGYPQSLFPNWTKGQVKKSGILQALANYDVSKPCTLYRVNVDRKGFFTNPGEIEAPHGNDAEVWKKLINDSDQVRKSLFAVHEILTFS